jgi:hypothetical protein
MWTDSLCSLDDKAKNYGKHPCIILLVTQMVPYSLNSAQLLNTALFKISQLYRKYGAIWGTNVAIYEVNIQRARPIPPFMN